jgi:hypothetical protein
MAKKLDHNRRRKKVAKWVVKCFVVPEDAHRRRKGSLASSASQRVRAVVEASGQGNRARWQAIQDAMPYMPDDSLRNFMFELWEVVYGAQTGQHDTNALDDIIRRWYERARFAIAYHAHPVDPDNDTEWSDRWF